jgi:hypothetical protein
MVMGKAMRWRRGKSTCTFNHCAEFVEIVE